MFDWKTQYRGKIISPENAALLLKDNMFIHFGALPSDPWYLAQYIHARSKELNNVVIYGDLMRDMNNWDHISLDNSDNRHIEFRSGYLTPGTRSTWQRKHLHYTPGTVFTDHFRYSREIPRPDIGFFHMTTPDENNTSGFGIGLWDNKINIQKCGLVVAEVQENMLRTAGDNFIDSDLIDYFVIIPDGESPKAPARPERTPVNLEAIDVAAALTASLVNDGDTLEIGVGLASNAVTPHLFDKKDLGYHSELTSPGIAQLYEAGVINGSNKSRDIGKMCVTLLPAQPEDIEIVAQNYADWEVYGVDYIHNPSVIAAQRQMTAINTATMIDLTGQVVFDSVGRDQITGPGGQFEFVIGALYADGGRSIHVLPSLSGENSRFVPEFDAGARVGVPRFLTDIVVSEYGIASLQGKTDRQRAREIISIAHPDHRSELTSKAKHLGIL
jgi:4-hydroxybutyrate CoA-transferase